MYISSDYKQFIESVKNRRDFIIEWLKNNGVKAVVMPVDGFDHILVVFPKEAYNPLFKIKTVIAHYDVFPGSPGANDNTSSVFSLMVWAVWLYRCGFKHNIRLIFTDGEEMAEKSAQEIKEKGIALQGSFALADVFKRLNITDDDVFVFDCVGRGTIPILSRSVLPLKVSSKFKKNFYGLESRLEGILRSSCGGRFVRLPIPYSDNAGFLAHGIASCAITILPENEVNEYMYNLMRVPCLEDFVINHRVPKNVKVEDLAKLLPLTWKKFHSTEDNILSLTEESFVLMERILYGIAMLKTMCQK